VASTSTTALPRPAERPTADIVIYDGHCRLCTRSAERLARADRCARLAFLSRHDPEVERRWPDLSQDDLAQYLYVITPEGRRHRGADALRHLSTRLPPLYWLSPFLHLPGAMPLWRRLYRALARHRFRFGRVEGCDDGSCRLHRTPEP
jgi:predicted DCC family thiol-disulfide oxidoreductase YuxK